MKKVLILLALALVSTSALAADPAPTIAQQIEAKKKELEALQAVATPTNVSAAVREEAAAWGNLGANMGHALVGAAKEVGVATNEFAATPLGKVTVGIVAYKIVGRELLHYIGGSIFLLVTWSWATYVLMRGGYTYTYEYKPFLFGLWSRKVVTAKTPPDGSELEGYQILGGIVLGIGTVVGMITFWS